MWRKINILKCDLYTIDVFDVIKCFLFLFVQVTRPSFTTEEAECGKRYTECA